MVAEDARMTRPSLRIAMVASFAALYIALSTVSPFIPAIGLPDIKIRLEASIASVFGVMLGPYLGASAALIGTIGAMLLHGVNIFDLIFVLNPALNALTVGLIFTKRWKAAFTLFALTVLAFWFTPLCHPLLEYWYVGLAATFDKIIALFLIIPASIILSSKEQRLRTKPGVGFTLLLLTAFVGNQIDSMFGSFLFALPPIYEGIFGLPTDVTRWLFVVSPFVYPAIRLIQAVVAAAVGLPLIRALSILGVSKVLLPPLIPTKPVAQTKT